MTIIPIQQKHYPAIAAIYEEGMSTGIATFETEVPLWEQWTLKFLPHCRFVLIVDNEVAGWCALSPVSKRKVYQGVAEDTIYIAKKFQNKGHGKMLLEYLITESEKFGYWTLQAAIFPQNTSSIHLHDLCGFRQIGIREKIAKRDGIWYDNVMMERRKKPI